MRRLISSLFVVLAVLTAVPATSSAQSRSQWEAYWMRQRSRAIERAIYEEEQRIMETRYRERVLQKEAERLRRAEQQAADYFGGGYPAYRGGAYGGAAWSSWPRQSFPGYGDLYSYPYDYSYGGVGSYRGSWGRIVNGGMYFDALVVPCRILSGRQRTQKFAAKVLAGVVGGAALDRGNRKRGALLGGGAGTAWALVDDSNYCSPPKQVLLPMNPAGMNQGGGAEMLSPPSTAVPSDSASAVSSAKGGLSLRNESGETAFVYDGDEAVTTLAAGALASVGKPKASYRAIVERFNERGTVEFWELGRRAEGATLVFIAEAQLLPRAPAETGAR